MIILIHDMLHSCSTISEKLHRTAFLSGILNKSGRFFGFLCSTKYTITILFKKILTTTYLPFSDKHIGVIYCKYLLIIIEIHNYLNQQKKVRMNVIRQGPPNLINTITCKSNSFFCYYKTKASTPFLRSSGAV